VIAIASPARDVQKQVEFGWSRNIVERLHVT
jgi:hypothetical protein